MGQRRERQTWMERDKQEEAIQTDKSKGRGEEGVDNNLQDFGTMGKSRHEIVTLENNQNKNEDKEI